MTQSNGDARRARQAARHQLVELLLASAGDQLLALEEEGNWRDEHATFESLLRSTFDEEAIFYLRLLAGAKVRRHLRQMGIAKLDALRQEYAAELAKLPPEQQINAWIAVLTSGSIDIGTVKMTVEKLLAGGTAPNR
jgi:hypothetical protein